MALICLNMLVMMIQHYGQSEKVDLTMNIFFETAAVWFYYKSIETTEVSCHS